MHSERDNIGLEYFFIEEEMTNVEMQSVVLLFFRCDFSGSLSNSLLIISCEKTHVNV